MDTFTPDLSDLYLTLAVSGGVMALMVYLGVRANQLQDPDPRRRVLLPMLAYFGALLGLMAFLGALWSTFKYPTVEVQDRQLVIDGQRYPVPPPSAIRMEAVGKGVNTTGRVLLIQTRDRRNWVFPDSRYDTQRLYALLRGVEG